MCFKNSTKNTYKFLSWKRWWYLIHVLDSVIGELSDAALSLQHPAEKTQESWEVRPCWFTFSAKQSWTARCWKWKYCPAKHWKLFTSQYGITSLKTSTLINADVRNSHIASSTLQLLKIWMNRYNLHVHSKRCIAYLFESRDDPNVLT